MQFPTKKNVQYIFQGSVLVLFGIDKANTYHPPL